jgi:hypothetical protein
LGGGNFRDGLTSLKRLRGPSRNKGTPGASQASGSVKSEKVASVSDNPPSTGTPSLVGPTRSTYYQGTSATAASQRDRARSARPARSTYTPSSLGKHEPGIAASESGSAVAAGSTSNAWLGEMVRDASAKTDALTETIVELKAQSAKAAQQKATLRAAREEAKLAQEKEKVASKAAESAERTAHVAKFLGGSNEVLRAQQLTEQKVQESKMALAELSALSEIHKGLVAARSDIFFRMLDRPGISNTATEKIEASLLQCAEELSIKTLFEKHLRQVKMVRTLGSSMEKGKGKGVAQDEDMDWSGE